MTAKTNLASHEDIREALLRSGYLIEYRLEHFLKQKGTGLAQANRAYPDPHTGKTREIDLFSMQAAKAGEGTFDYLFGVMLIECFNNPQPLAFFTKSPLPPFLHRNSIKFSGIPTKVQKQTETGYTWTSLAAYLELDKNHHYCQGKIATQYCSFKQKSSGQKGEWMAFHDEESAGTFSKLCDALNDQRELHFRRGLNLANFNLQIYYPIVVVQNELLEIEPQANGDIVINTVDHIQYVKEHISDVKSTSYQIDVLTEAYFGEFTDLVERE